MRKAMESPSRLASKVQLTVARAPAEHAGVKGEHSDGLAEMA